MSDSDEIDMEDMNKVNGRVLRNRKYRRPFEDSRADKRLFTPEIKRHLKTWLIRRRENPYPNREEKKELAVQTGLTYIQICNWFANWRRKLKNAGRNVNKFTWSTLIKSYNNQIIGNLEHLSISSDDSIWEEADLDQPQVDHSYTSLQSLRPNRRSLERPRNNLRDRNWNYQRVSQSDELLPIGKRKRETNPVLLSKWRRSAACFRPSCKSYLIDGTESCKSKIPNKTFESCHDREELDAAEALTSLSRTTHIKFT
ncbi:UNVERIFIED_CONTAM: hypothetical protein PYX00_006170 [Menopon gallinae]|uniref:Homeobox domain-containing protein n=1 Tax=Menopon gallinae TaxID=328185 RepID=A0AAW2HUI3_9NEOP